MPRYFKIDQTIKPEHRSEVENLALDSAISLDSISAWLHTRGYKISRNSIHNWRTELRAIAADPARHLRRYLNVRIEAMPLSQLTVVCECVNRFAA